jgi:quinol monooxygenase YgiN
MIYVVATIELKDAKFREEYLKVLNANVPKVRAEDGCKMYQPAVDFPSGLSAQKRVCDKTVTILECWESFEHLQAHLKAPHMAEYREKARPYVNPTVINVMESV